MNTPILVYVDLAGVSKRVGTLWTRVRNTRQSATFEYAGAWFGDPNRFALEPALAIGPGPHHTPADIPLFGSLMDSAPDRWGQVLMRRAERRLSMREGRAPRTMMLIGYSPRRSTWGTRPPLWIWPLTSPGTSS